MWPGFTVFTDIFHPNASKYWTDMLYYFRTKLNYSGLWLDMNELANFCDGECP